MAAVRAESGAMTVTLPGKEEIVITRALAAPRHLVYRAWTTPELVERWWSGGRATVTRAEVDLRVGGAWRYSMVVHDGSEIAFHGEYREIVADERIVYTEVREGSSEVEALTTVTFSDTGQDTIVTIRVRFGRERDRDAHSTYMADGLRDALDLLERIAVALSE